ncbi:MAG TPA: amino acid ABC transporter permease [Candidatus Acidoferrales bacterium]|nr:amino acid ABC transporter permease [Candidatus Acidoferrales bacterium]
MRGWVEVIAALDTVFLPGLAVTCQISFLALGLALCLGVVSGVASTAPWKPLRLLARSYVEFFQNTPLLLQLFFLFYSLPYWGIRIDAFWASVLSLGIYTGAYVSEVVRAGIGSVGRGQFDAGLAQGFGYGALMRYIILPQVRVVILPPLTNQCLNLVKNSAVAMIVGAGDLFYRTDNWQSQNFLTTPAYVTAALLYLSITFPLSLLAVKLERRTAWARWRAPV